jgi:hypothetical protein
MANQVRRVSCGFCKNAGLYGRKAAHLVKDCPVLAQTECRYCHKLGHTKTRCDILKKKKTTMRSHKGLLSQMTSHWIHGGATLSMKGGRTMMPHQGYRRRASGRTLFDHVEHSLKAGTPIISEPVAKGKTLKKQSQNSYAVLEESDAAVKYIALPKVVKVEEPLKGAWANKLADKPVAELKVVKEPTCAMQEAEPEKCHEDVYDMRVALNRRAYEVFNQEPVPSYIGSWADACDSDSDGEIEEEIVFDSMGRPSTDNSAWS